jgi:hypothetical protein
MGEFVQLPLVLFKIGVRSGNPVRKVRAVFESILPNDPRAAFFPFMRLGMEHWKLVQISPLRGKEKFIAYLDIILCFLLKYKVLLSDPVFTFYLNLSKLAK